MNYLRFAGSQYIDTGIAPSDGYTIETTIKIKPEIWAFNDVRAIFGSRGTSGSANSTSFNMFKFSTINISTGDIDNYFRADYAGAGDTTSLNIGDLNYSMTNMIFSIKFGKTTTVNDMDYVTASTLSSSGRSIYIGSLNNAGSPDSRMFMGEIGEFIILNASGVEVFHGIPVASGDTTYSGTPAPSNCYWDTISSSYKVNAGSNYIGFTQDDINNVETTVIKQGNNYGMKVIGTDVADFMNSKYKLFGTDITKTGQFVTYNVTLAGYNTEPPGNYPPYVEDNTWHSNEDLVYRDNILTYNTNIDPNKVMAVIISHNAGISTNMYSRMLFYINSPSYNTYINPNSTSGPDYVGLDVPKLLFPSTSTWEYYIFGGLGSGAIYTVPYYSPSTWEEYTLNAPEIYVRLDSNGVLRFKSAMPVVSWSKAASGGFRSRIKTWFWLQGVTIKVTLLVTPYDRN